MSKPEQTTTANEQTQREIARRFARAAIETPHELADRCSQGSAERADSTFTLDEVIHMHRNRIGRGLASTAAIAAAVLILVWVGPFSLNAPSADAAEVLRAALAAFDVIEAIHIHTEVRTDPAGEPVESFDIRADRALGYRVEHAAHTEIVNLRANKTWRLDAEGAIIEEIDRASPMMVSEFLRRGDAARNIQTLIVQAEAASPEFRDDVIESGDSLVRRMTAPDSLGRTIVVIVDARRHRVLRTEGWTYPTPGYDPVYVVTQFSHLEGLDPALFTPAAGAPVGAQPANSAEMRLVSACMLNLRDLATLLIVEMDKNDALPATLQSMAGAQGFERRFLVCPASSREAPVRYAYLGPNLDPSEEPSQQSLLECRNHGRKTVRAYLDGHVQVVTD